MTFWEAFSALGNILGLMGGIILMLAATEFRKPEDTTLARWVGGFVAAFCMLGLASSAIVNGRYDNLNDKVHKYEKILCADAGGHISGDKCVVGKVVKL